MAQDLPGFKLHILPDKKIHTRILWMASNAYWGEEDILFSLSSASCSFSSHIPMNVSEFCIYFKKSVSSSHGWAAEHKSSPRDYFYSYTKALFKVFILRMRSMEWLGNKNATCSMMKMLGVQKKSVDWAAITCLCVNWPESVPLWLRAGCESLLRWCENF